MRLAKRFPSSGQKGFTLIELLVVLAIMGMVATAIYTFFGFTHKSYANAEAQSILTNESTLFFTQIDKEIRNASQPNSDTRAVNISNDGKQIDIYQFDGSKYKQIRYQVNPTNNQELEKGSVSVNAPVTGTNPDYGTINNWETITTHLLPNNGIYFADRNDGDDISKRRLIDIFLTLKHPKFSTALHTQSSIMSRTGSSTENIESGGGAYSSYVPVTSIKIVTAPGLFPKSGGTQTIVAKVKPDHATNRSLIWSQQILSLPWLSFPEYSLSYDDRTGSVFENLLEGVSKEFGYWDTMTTRSGSGVDIKADKSITLLPKWLRELLGMETTRKANIRVFSPDGVENIVEIVQER